MLESLKHEDLQFQELSPEEKQSRGILARLSGPIASFTKGTRNGRKYSDKLWEKAFDSPLVKEMFKNGGLPGELQHPENRSETDPTKIAIMMPEPPKKDSNGHLVASVDILDTPCGQIAYQLGKYGFKFGISSRGEGDLITDFSGEESVDPDTYTLNAFDLVLIPACEDARLQFNEGIEKNKKNRLVTILGESLMNASDADRLVMEEAIDELDIEDNIQFKSTYEGVDIYFDPQDKKYIVYGMDGDEEKFNSESNAQKYIDRFVVESLTESQVGREETKDSEKPSDILQNKPENQQQSSMTNQDIDIQDEEDAELLDEALTPQEKMDAWHKGNRRENIKACGDRKLATYIKICKNSGYDKEANIIRQEFERRGIPKELYENINEKSLLENLVYKGFLIKYNDDGVSIYDGDGIELYDNIKNIKSAKARIDHELNTWGPEEAFGGVKLIEEIDSEEGSQDKASWDTDFHRLDVAYNHNFKQFEDMEEDKDALNDFIEDLDNQHKKYTVYKHEKDPGCTVFFKESLNEDALDDSGVSIAPVHVIANMRSKDKFNLENGNIIQGKDLLDYFDPYDKLKIASSPGEIDKIVDVTTESLNEELDYKWDIYTIEDILVKAWADAGLKLRRDNIEIPYKRGNHCIVQVRFVDSYDFKTVNKAAIKKKLKDVFGLYKVTQSSQPEGFGRPGYGKELRYDLYLNDPDTLEESLNESVEWEELNGTEQSAVEMALAAIKHGSTIEDAVHGAVEDCNWGNVEPEYEDEDFFGEEANYTKVLDYVKSHEGLNESFGKDYSDIPEIKSINYKERINNGLPGISNMKAFIKALEEVGEPKFKIRSSRFPLSHGDIKDEWMDIKRHGWSISQTWDSSLSGFNEVYICKKLNEDLNEESVRLAADDDGAIVEQLQNILKQNKSLEEKVKGLQEKLSVGYAKEMELREELDTYKQRVSKLSSKTKEIKVLTEKLSKAEKKIKDNKAQAEGKISTLNESISSKEFENKDLRKDISTLNETLGKKDSLIKSLDEQLGKYKDKLNSKQADIEQLKEQYETGQKDLEQLKTQYAKKIEQQNQIIEKYQRVAKNSVKRYIESQAVRLGVKSDEIVNRLPKNYSFNDIDIICEDLQEYKFNISNLPFNPQGLNEGLKVTAKNISKGLIEANPDDEITEYDLKIAEAYI